MTYTPPVRSLIAGTVVTSGVATPLTAASRTVEQVLVQSDPANSDDILLGSSTSQPIVLQPGASISVPVSRTEQLYHKASSGTPTLNYLAD